jgi:hypothetical protein
LAQFCSQIEKLSFYVSYYNLNIVLVMPCVWFLFEQSQWLIWMW